MSTKEKTFEAFLRDVLRRYKRRPSQLARELGISHSTVSRWLSGVDAPSVKSCQKLAENTGVSLQKILSIAGHLPLMTGESSHEWPEFREYVRQKYPNELDDDLITMLEDLIERRRARNHGKKYT